MLLTRLVLPLLAATMLVAAPTPPWTGLPLRTTTHSHIPGDPINVAFEGSRVTILGAFRVIGWVQADPLSVRNDERLARDAVFHRSYPTAPVSRLYLFGRVEDFAVEHELGSVARRDHARFWDTHRRDATTGLELWIGSASRDVRIEILRRHHVPIGTTHHIDPNLDAERTLIVTALRRTPLVRAVVMEPGIGRTTNGHNASADPLFTDGRVAVIILRL